MARVGGRVLRGMAAVSLHQDWQWEEGQDMLVNLSFEYLQEPFREPASHPAPPSRSPCRTAGARLRTQSGSTVGQDFIRNQQANQP